MNDRNNLRAALSGRDFVFNPSRLAVASQTMEEWLNSGDLPDDMIEDFQLARDSMEILYSHITCLPERNLT